MGQVRNNNTCLGCMQSKGQAQVCPFCGYREGTPAQAPHYLTPGTVLVGKYLLGRGLGHGGFGTTYVAKDLVLGIKLAIKEFLPSDCATRAAGSAQVTAFSGEGEQRFRAGLESFLQEARTLARFDGQPNIVGVRDFFTENGTAYLVMNHLEGITLKQFIVRSGGKPLPYEKVLGILLPVMGALCTVHESGLLHRDISPDNIFLTTSGQVVLIDFGAARQSMSANQSMSVILKPGYAPEEQYRSRGHQGPWTDVYALGATMYRTLTATIPPEALERLRTDSLIPPSRMGISIPPYAESAILRAMAVRAEERFQSVEEFRLALRGRGDAAPLRPQARTGTARPAPVQSAKPQQDPATYPLGNKRKKKKSNKTAIIVTCILVAVLLGGLSIGISYLQYLMDDTQVPSFSQKPTPTASPTQEPKVTPAPTVEPTLVPEETPLAKITPEVEPWFAPGALPAQELSEFAPRKGRLIVTDSFGEREVWITGRAPAAYSNMLMGQFQLNEETGEPLGAVYGYYLDGQGNLCYLSTAEGGGNFVVLPANCAVGTSFSGNGGTCKVVAVNYSARVGKMRVADAIVISTPEGYLFLEPNKGQVLLASDLEGTQVSWYIVSDEKEDTGIYDAYIE